jgi:hypothetical protein
VFGVKRADFLRKYEDFGQRFSQPGEAGSALDAGQTG